MFQSVENDSQCSGESILSQSGLFCFALSPLSPTCPSNQLWLQAFSGLVASEFAKDHQWCWSHNGVIVIVTEFCSQLELSRETENHWEDSQMKAPLFEMSDNWKGSETALSP